MANPRPQRFKTTERLNSMPFLRLKEIQEMSSEKRMEKLNELRTELRKLSSMNKAGGSIDNPSRIKEIRKAIARILTVQKGKKA